MTKKKKNKGNVNYFYFNYIKPKYLDWVKTAVQFISFSILPLDGSDWLPDKALQAQTAPTEAFLKSIFILRTSVHILRHSAIRRLVFLLWYLGEKILASI